MDNLTHTLIGLNVAQAAIELRPRKSKRLAGAAFITSALANNFPDCDFLFSHTRLSYLVQHRGYTHSFFSAPFEAAFIMLLVKFLYSRWGDHFSKEEWKWLGKIGVLGVFLHILADSMNTYGVHPLWPFYNGWFYGDSVFIVEPFLWLVLTPALYFSFQGRRAWVFLAIALFTVVASWFVPLIPKTSAAVLTIWGGVLYWFLSRTEKQLRTLTAIGTAIILVLASFSFRTFVERNLEEEIARRFPHAQTHDIVLSPYPANPFCWRFIAVQTEPEYTLRQGVFALAPHWFKAQACPRFFTRSAQLTLDRVPAPSSEQIDWMGQFQRPSSELKELRTRFCGVRAFLHFSRAPYWISAPSRMVVGDLRFSQLQRDEKSPFTLDQNILQECPSPFPTWIEPRADVLND